MLKTETIDRVLSVNKLMAIQSDRADARR